MPSNYDTPNTPDVPAQTEVSPFEEPKLEPGKSSLNDPLVDEPKLVESLAHGGQGEETKQNA